MPLADDIIVAATYFNPLGSRRRLWNFLIFHKVLRAWGVPVLVVEQCMEGRPSQLQGRVENLHLVPRGGTLWQKERLLNLAAGLIPRKYEKIIWADADMLFGAALGLSPTGWVNAFSAALDGNMVAQGFSRLVHLREFPWQPPHTFYEGFAWRWLQDGRPAEVSGDYLTHGHTGHVWGARREFWDQVGLYDRCVTCSSDALMAHAFIGAVEGPSLTRRWRHADAAAEDERAWAERCARVVDRRLGCVEARVLHLWHGKLDVRHGGESDRNARLRALGFDPQRDLEVNEHGAWDWTDPDGPYAAWSRDYFEARKDP